MPTALLGMNGQMGMKGYKPHPHHGGWLGGQRQGGFTPPQGGGFFGGSNMPPLSGPLPPYADDFIPRGQHTGGFPSLLGSLMGNKFIR